MIITRTPLRISFVGGGSDLPWFYREEPGAVVNAAIDKYVYVTHSKKYEGTFRAAYSQMETVTDLHDLKHELIRETLLSDTTYYRLGGREIHSIADLPGSTGLGSSSAFTVGLCKAFWPYVDAAHLGALAADIEINKCKKTIGVQDHYIAAFGGVNTQVFVPTHPMTPSAIDCDTDVLSDHCLLLDTGTRRVRDAGEEISAQNHDRESVRELAHLVTPFSEALQANDFESCGRVMHTAWEVKSALLKDQDIQDRYDIARMSGAWGGKLCGAGGGGFMLFLAPPGKHYAIATTLGMRRVSIKVGVEGSKVLYSD